MNRYDLQANQKSDLENRIETDQVNQVAYFRYPNKGVFTVPDIKTDKETDKMKMDCTELCYNPNYGVFTLPTPRPIKSGLCTVCWYCTERDTQNKFPVSSVLIYWYLCLFLSGAIIAKFRHRVGVGFGIAVGVDQCERAITFWLHSRMK